MKFPVEHFLGFPRNGVDLASMNLGDFEKPTGPVRGQMYPVYKDELFDWLQAKKVTSVRVPFTWEAVLPSINGELDPHINYTTCWADGLSVPSEAEQRSCR